MKSFGKKIIVLVLAWQVRRLVARHKPYIIGVVGSIGKTSTKLAIAEALSTHTSVCYQKGNYNDLVSVPLVFFGHVMPSLLNPIAWIRIFVSNETVIRKTYPYKTIVLELGTDGPGQISAFHKYLQLDVAVVTAITPEHMEYFGDLDAVAREELAVTRFAKIVFANADLVNAKYLQDFTDIKDYAIKAPATLTAQKIVYTEAGTDFSLKQQSDEVQLHIAGFSTAHVYSALAAVAVVKEFGVSGDSLQKSLDAITPVSGRMQRLDGIYESTIIDDSYNASPEAVKSALDTVYRIDAPQKIVLLGNMNELGTMSPEAHTEIGNYCEPSHLSQVITLGPDANTYLAPAAKAKGCDVRSFDSPYEAGDYIATIITTGTLVLIKGSQNKVFAEEAIKPLLRNPADIARLVRQSEEWLAIKQKQFTPIAQD